MEETATPTTRSRRRRTASYEGATVQVVIPISPDASTPSSNKTSTRAKRDRRASTSRDTISPPPTSDEPPKKMRTRRSPSKGASAISKPHDPSILEAKQDTSSTAIDVAGAASSSTTPAPGAEIAAQAPQGSNATKASSSRHRASSALNASPTAKPPRDLASELFDDDDDDDDHEKEEDEDEAGKTETQAAARNDVSGTAAGKRANADSQACQVEVVIPSRKRRRAGSGDSQLDSQPSSSSFTTAVESEPPGINNATNTASLQLRIRQLEIQLAESKKQAEQSATIVGAQHTIFKELHGVCVCHICLEPSFRPCVLAPCGHVFCIHCLRSWFTRRTDSEAAPPQNWSQEEIERYERSRTLKRKKICPSCRTELACPPVEVFLVRDMLEKVDHGLELSKNASVDAELAESSTAILSVDDKVRLKGEDLPKGAKLWQDIFDEDGPRRIIFDEMDGVPRCGSCGSEIFDGACSNPSCAIEYDSHSDYEDLRRGGWDDMNDFDSDRYSDDDDDGGGGGGGRHRPRRNGALAERLADFEARHGGSEALHRGGNRLELPDDFSGITYIDSSDNEHVIEDHTLDQRRRDRARGRRHPEDDEEDDEEMDDFIVPDEDDERPNYFDRSGSDDDGGSPQLAPWHERDFDDVDSDDEDEEDEEEDDFLPGPRGHRGESAIEISDDDDEDDSRGGRDSSVEYRGRRGGRRVVDEDDDEDGESPNGSEGLRAERQSVSEDEGRRGGLGSSTDSARRRRARIVDDDEEDEGEDGM